MLAYLLFGQLILGSLLYEMSAEGDPPTPNRQSLISKRMHAAATQRQPATIRTFRHRDRVEQLHRLLTMRRAMVHIPFEIAEPKPRLSIYSSAG